MRLYDRYRWFHEHAGYVVGRSAECALRLARAEERAGETGLSVTWEEENIPWDGDCPSPDIHVLAYVPHPQGGMPLASLGSIGLNSWSDPYVRVVEAELFAEALETLDTEADARACSAASELATRATYAAGGFDNA